MVHGNFPGIVSGDVDFLDVTEDSVTDPAPLFEFPEHTLNKLTFVPTGFGAVASNGAMDTTSAQLTMRIRADEGHLLSFIVFREFGDTTLSGPGTTATSTGITASLSLQDLSPGGSGPFADSVDFSPASFFTLPSDSFVEFDGLAVIDLSAFSISEVFLTFENALIATSELGTTSLIQKKTITVEHSETFVPEPGTLTMLLLGSLSLVRRRRF